MRYKWLLFDLDGTLFDYDAGEEAALIRTFAKHRIPYQPDYLDVYRDINHHIWSDFEKGLITQTSIKKTRFRLFADALKIGIDVTTFNADYLNHLSAETHMVDGAEALIKNLCRRYDMALVTNGLKDVQRPRINASPIGTLFKEIIISEEIGFAKPDQRFFDITFERIGSPPRETVLLIGDSLSSDMQGGTRYQIDTCWYNPGRKEATARVQITHEITSISQIDKLLE